MNVSAALAWFISHPTESYPLTAQCPAQELFFLDLAQRQVHFGIFCCCHIVSLHDRNRLENALPLTTAYQPRHKSPEEVHRFSIPAKRTDHVFAERNAAVRKIAQRRATNSYDADRGTTDCDAAQRCTSYSDASDAESSQPHHTQAQSTQSQATNGHSSQGKPAHGDVADGNHAASMPAYLTAFRIGTNSDRKKRAPQKHLGGLPSDRFGRIHKPIRP